MKVKLARIKKGLTQDQLRKMVNTSPRKIVEIERGNYDNITFLLMKKIAKVLDTTVQELFFDEDGEN